jgi:pimeloyl-ACP methyl ester carboxylesterase
VRLFASNYPNDVIGMVLVDSSHPDQAQKLHLSENPTAHLNKWEPFLPLTRSLGILWLGLRTESRPSGFSSAQWNELLDQRDRTNSYRTLLREGEAWAESASQVRAGGDLGAKPLLVLTGARDADAQWRSLWVDGLQANLVHLSSKGRHIVLENSGHGIQFDAPEEVVRALRTIWNEARAARGDGSL